MVETRALNRSYYGIIGELSLFLAANAARTVLATSVNDVVPVRMMTYDINTLADSHLDSSSSLQNACLYECTKIPSG